MVVSVVVGAGASDSSPCEVQNLVLLGTALPKERMNTLKSEFTIYPLARRRVKKIEIIIIMVTVN